VRKIPSFWTGIVFKFYMVYLHKNRTFFMILKRVNISLLIKLREIIQNFWSMIKLTNILPILCEIDAILKLAQILLQKTCVTTDVLR
jgi:hypothetical protein